jgi:hypothetical protein
VLNGSLIRNCTFYDGCAIEQWSGGTWYGPLKYPAVNMKPEPQPAPSAPLEGTGNGADERSDALYDSAYCAGVQEGFRLGDAGDNEGFRKALESRAGYVKVLRDTRAPRTEVAGAVPIAMETRDTKDARYFRWLCAHPDWHFIESLCQQFVAESQVEFYTKLSAEIEKRIKHGANKGKKRLPNGSLAFPDAVAAAPQPPSADAAAAPADERAAFDTRACAESLNLMITEWVDSCLRMGVKWHGMTDVIEKRIARFTARAAASQPAAAAGQEAVAFQSRVQPWMLACFGVEIAADRIERNHRFLEEALELVQACGCTSSEAHQLVDYTFGRPVGEQAQEAGGVMVTLAALCLANGLDMHAAGETELARVWTKVDQIRAKQAAKPKHSPLPEAAPPAQIATRQGLTEKEISDAVTKWFPDRAYQAPFFARELLEGAKHA